MENNYCVYMHKCKDNGKVYIGLTINTNTRWRNNGIAYKPYKKNTRPFWNAICKYGWSNFEHIILEDNLSKEQSEDKEIYYIKKFDSRNRSIGYNVAEGGNGGRIYIEHPKGMKGKKQSKKWIEMIKKANSGENNGFVRSGGWNTHEHPKGMKGKKHSDYVKTKISKTFKDKNINCKPILLIMPNGVEHIFKSKTETSLFLGVKQESSMFLNCFKTGLPYKIKTKNQYTKNLQHLEGLIIKLYTENTEIIIDSKESITS